MIELYIYRVIFFFNKKGITAKGLDNATNFLWLYLATLISFSVLMLLAHLNIYDPTTSEIQLTKVYKGPILISLGISVFLFSYLFKKKVKLFFESKRGIEKKVSKSVLMFIDILAVVTVPLLFFILIRSVWFR
jgi:hypothetical protein